MTNRNVLNLQCIYNTCALITDGYLRYEVAHGKVDKG